MITSVAGKSSRQRTRSAFTKWLAPYRIATKGGEAKMLRFLDDPDVPCYEGNWKKVDKNRFHQERAPGGPKKYVFNPDNWVVDFKDSLTAVSIANEYPYPGNGVPNYGWQCKRGALLITPQHILCCNHSPVEIGTLAYPTTLRFVGTDGETYDRTMIGVRRGLEVPVNGVLNSGDSYVGTLDSPLPPEVIPMRFIPNHWKFTARYSTWEKLYVNQSTEAEANSSFWPCGYCAVPGVHDGGGQLKWYPYKEWCNTGVVWTPPNYPLQHRSYTCLGWSSDPKVGYHCWGGDSGFSEYIAWGTELICIGFVPGGGGGANTYPRTVSGIEVTWEDMTNAMIALSDADAMTRGLGVLGAPTGYTISLANEIPDLLPP